MGNGERRREYELRSPSSSPLSAGLRSLISDLRFPISVFLITLPAWLPLLLDPGLVNTRAGGDSPFLLQRVYEMGVALRGGHFPARWMPDAAFGHGYPFWNYYAPLVFYVAAVFHLAGLSIVNAIKLTQILGFLAAGAGMYLLAEDIFESRPAAVLAAAAYTYAPFHLVNVYVRGDSLGEFVAFAFYPFIFLGLHRLCTRPGPGPAAFTAMTYAGLILSHNISALIFTPFAIAYALWQYAIRNTQHALRTTHYVSNYILWTAVAFALGLTLSAWYWLPALREQDAVQLEQNLTGYFHYAGHFRSTNLVQRSPLFNFDVDAAGTPFAMGLVQAVLGLLGCFLLIPRHRAESALRSTHYAVCTTLFFAGTAVAATFLITPWSRPLWDHIPLLPFVQFPWRWLSVQAFALSLIIGGLAVFPVRRPQDAIGSTHSLVSWALALSLSLLAIFTSTPGLRVEYLPVRDRDITPEHLMLYEMFTGNIGSTVRAEYLPDAVNPRPWTSAMLAGGGPVHPVGATSAALLSRGPASQRWRITVDEPRDVIFPTYWFPGWRATIDGRPAETAAQPNHGGIRIALPAGTHQVELALGRTPARRLAELASTVGLLFLLMLLVRCGLSRQDLRRIGALAAIVIVAGLSLGVASGLTRTIEGPLTMDFSRMPYLHPNPGGVRFANGFRLHGYELSTVELEAEESLEIEMRWEGEGPASQLEIALVSPEEVLFHVPAVVTEARAEVGDRTRLRLKVPARVTAGLYLPRLRLLSGDAIVPARTPKGTEFDTLYLQPIHIRPTTAAPGHIVGRFADLAGVGDIEAQLISPGRVEVRMTWWAEQLIPANYATSIRLKTATGETVAQRDTQPCYGYCPTSSWVPGTPVYDRRWLDLPADASPDKVYHLEIVLYEAASLAPIGMIQTSVIRLTRSAIPEPWPNLCAALRPPLKPLGSITKL